MSTMLAVFVLLYSALLGCWALGSAARGARLGLGYLGGLVLLELTLLVRAGIELTRLVSASGGPHGEFGRGYAEPGVHAGYLIASIVVLPLVLTLTRTNRGPVSSADPAEQLDRASEPVVKAREAARTGHGDQNDTTRKAPRCANGAPEDPKSEDTTPEDTTFEATKLEDTKSAGAADEDISARRARRREATWDALVAAVGCAAVAVVTIRLGMTGRPA
jgi:hypothetical protein